MKAETFLPDDYMPAEDEPFMDDMQTEYFRRKLLAWRSDILETDRSLELRTRDRERKLVSKIDGALRRIEEGEFGYCSVTGEPISLKRLDARPIAIMSLEAQERHERREKIHRDD